MSKRKPSGVAPNSSVINFAPKRQCVRYSASLPLANQQFSQQFSYQWPINPPPSNCPTVSPFAVPTMPAPILQQSAMVEMLQKYVDRSINRVGNDPKVDKPLLPQLPVMSAAPNQLECKCVWVNLDGTQVPCVGHNGTLFVPVSVAELLLLARFYVSFSPRQVKSRLTNVDLMSSYEAAAFNLLNSSENYLLGFKFFSKGEAMWPLADIRNVYWDLKLIFLKVQLQQFPSSIGTSNGVETDCLQQRLMGDLVTLQKQQQLHQQFPM